MNIQIPQRPDNDEKYGALTKIEKEMIVTAVLRGVPNRTAFLWFNPHYAAMAGKPDKNGFSSFRLSEKGEEQSDLFWRYPKVREFRADYERTLEEFLGRKQTSRASADEPITDKRKDEALKSLFDKAMTLVEGQGDLDADTLKIAAEIFKKIGLLKDDVEVQEAPRRYIPIRCRQECQYRFFVEKHIETGEIVSDCEYCKALAIAKEHGYHYDPTTNLSIPEETETPKENNPE